jgi:hypothetical protein
MNTLYSRAIAAKIVVGLAIAAMVALSGCGPARFALECARRGVGCQ